VSAIRGVVILHELCSPTPDTVVVAGVGRGTELATMREAWPSAKIVGVEPLRCHCQLWDDGSFPGVLVEAALWSRSGISRKLFCNHLPDQRASLYPLTSPLEGEVTEDTTTISLDDLRSQTGPWGQTLLWLDVEGAEVDVLGACKDWDGIRWVNVEVAYCPGRDRPSARAIDHVLWAAGFDPCGVHTVTRDYRQCDLIYVRRSDWEGLRLAVARDAVSRKMDRLAERFDRSLHRRRIMERRRLRADIDKRRKLRGRQWRQRSASPPESTANDCPES